MSEQTKRLGISLGVVTLVAAVIRGFMIWKHAPTPDDIYVLMSSSNYMSYGQTAPIVGYHPPLRNILTWAMTSIAGHGAFGVMGVSLVLGVATVPILGLLVWRMSRSVSAATLASSLLAMDILHISFSRQAIQEVHTTFFFMLGTLLAVEAFANQKTLSRWRVLVPLAGVAFGLGMASKGHALPPLIVSMGLLLWTAWRRRDWPSAVYVVVGLGGVSLLTYMATYLPWFQTGNSFAEWIAYQRAVYQATLAHVSSTAGYLSHDKAYEWFIRPFLGYADIAERSDGSMQLAVGLGNPLVWLAVWPAILWSLVKRARASQAHRVAQLYFWAAYLPLLLSSRSIWLLSALGVIPFAFAILALVANDLSKRVGWLAVSVYFVACGLVALLLLPLALGYALDIEYLLPIVKGLGGVPGFDI